MVAGRGRIPAYVRICTRIPFQRGLAVLIYFPLRAGTYVMVANNPGKIGPSPRLQALQALQEAGRMQEAEEGYRECLRIGEANAAGPLATLLLQQERDRE